MTRFRFDPFVLDVKTGQLLRGTAEVPLQPLAFELLRHLLERPGELLSRQDLMAVLWPGVIVTDNSLEQVVRRLRKALAPEEVVVTVHGRGYRLVADVAREADAPEPHPGNLRPLPGRFVGREPQLADLRHRIDRGERLITLTGPGGAGKTSLAHELALSVELPAWFVDLSACACDADVVHAAARTLSLSLEDRDAAGQVGWRLSRLGPALVLLDNFEQVVEAAATTVGRWLRDAPDVVFLVTSRVVLGLRGERAVPVAPLTADEGLALFADLAEVDVRDPDVARLVAALDGLPLAIQLAARRARVLSPAALLGRLNDRFALLTDPSPDRPERHHSLEAALGTSWDLLDDDERAALVQLTVFEGPFELGAAEAVLEVAGPVLDVLQALVDQSLVQATPPRFSLLDTIRAWASLQAGPSQRIAAEARHGRWFARGGGGVEVVGDVLAAVRRAVARGDAGVAADCALVAAGLLSRTGPVALAADVLEAALSADDGSRREELLRALVPILVSDRPHEARRAIEEATALARDRGDPRRVAVLALELSTIQRYDGHLDDAEATLLSALDSLRELGDRYHEGLALTRLGAVYARRNEPLRAIDHHEQALLVFRELGHRHGIATAATNLGIECEQVGRTEQAEACYREALAHYRALGVRPKEANALGNLAVLLARTGRSDEALVVQREALRLATELGLRRVEALQLGNLGTLHLERGEHDEGEPVLVRALDATRRLGSPVGEAHILLSLAQLHRERGNLSSAAADLELAQRALAGLGEVRLQAAAWLEAAEQGVARQEPDAARAALERAEVLSEGGRTLDPHTQARLRAVRRSVDQGS